MKAFTDGEYVKLHQSTLRKIDILANIVGRITDGTLKTNARFSEVYGGYFAFAIEVLKEHWLFALLSMIGAIASIVGLILYLVGG